MMARITAGIAASHVPAIGAAMDRDQVGTPYWSPSSTGSRGPVRGSPKDFPT
jgi:protocatechuate 4,5-dioxygenase, beta chain